MELPSLNHIIGIWGFGRVGRSVAYYLHAQGYTLAIMDSNRNLSSDNFLQLHAIPFYNQEEHDAFFTYCDYIIPSPGIDLKVCASHNHTWISELDLFYALWQKPIIAITGSIGKTTTTSLLAQLCKHNGISVAVGGNIGIPMFDLLAQKDAASWAILEVSSFQLEQCHFFAPDIAIITNVYANHLDRHGSYDAYLQGKLRIIMHQNETHHVIAPLALYDQLAACKLLAHCWYLTENYPSAEIMKLISERTSLVHLAEATIDYYISKNYRTYEKPNTLFSHTFAANALCVHVAFMLIQKRLHNTILPIMFDFDYESYPHRLEHVATYNGVTFINDSKSTTCASTLAAAIQYHDRPTILVLGGLSKGTNRKELIAQLPPSIIYVACFGAEAAQLATWCAEYHIKAHAFGNLELALQHSMSFIQKNMVILLSPSGSSFDLYAHYEERGNHFKQLVYAFIDNNKVLNYDKFDGK